MLQSFRTMLGRLQEMWKSMKPRHLWLGVFALVIAGAFLFVEPTYAQQGVATGVGDWLIRQVAKIMLVVASLSIGLSIFFLRFFIMIASYNNYIDVSVVQLGWVMVRDVANMFFVVALLLIAFGTILGLEEYEWKKNLAKLILSAILINFSNLIAQLCIDIAHVFTITFLNAISATAGGNLVNMFKLDQILALTAAQDPSGLDVEVLAAVLPAMLFAIMAAAAIGSYVVVMAARVVALWALIVISPLAFILGVIPQTKSYADKWWAEFSKYVIVAPIMVFFLWLSFATVGLGSIATEIEAGLPANVKTSGAEAQFGVQRLSMSKVTTWENMANFLIAFAFLMYGIKATQETGTLGSGMIGSAVDFGKKVATIASGYAAGRWLVGKGKDAAWAGTKWTADALAGDYYERAKLKLSKIPKGYENWKTMGPQWERKSIAMANDQKVADDYQLSLEEQKAGFTVEQREDGKYKVAGLNEVEKLLKYKIVEERDEKGNIKKDENGNAIRKKVRAGNVYNIKTDEQGNVIYKKNKDGTFATDDNGNKIAEGMDKPIYESWLQKRKHERYTKLLSARKRVEKIENDTKLNEEIADKGIEAVPEHWLTSRNKAMGKEYDRVKKGRLERMNKRSAAKTDEFAAEGDLSEADSYRLKDGRYQTERGTMAEQIAGHEGRAATFKSQLDEINALARKKFLDSKDGKKSFEGKIKADLEVKATNAAVSKLEAGLTNTVALDNLQATKDQNAKIDKYRTEMENASRNSSPEEFYNKQEKLLKEMMGEGLVSRDEYEEISKNQRINRAMAGHSDKSKEEALAALVREGVIAEEDRKKIAKDMGDTRELGYTFPKDRENVFQRTIIDEKGAHLESEKLSTLQKEEEGIFAQGAHGKEEAREIAVLKEKALAAEGKIKRNDEKGKADVADTIPRDGDSPELRAQKEAYAKARAEKIAAEKQAHTESEKTSTLEKEAERDYTKTGEGLHELQVEEILKERTARAEAEIKMEAAEAKKEVAKDSEEFKEAMEARIKAERQAGVRESAAQRFAKEAEAAYLAGEGKGESRQDAISKEQVAAAEAKIKKEEALSKQDVSTTGTFAAANRARIEAEKQAHTASEEVSTLEKERETEYTLSDHGKDELEREAILKERTAAADAKIKEQTAEAKRVMAAGDDEFIEAQKRRIAAERAASSRESQAQRFEKERGAEYAEGAGKADITAEQLAKEQIAAADARVKQQESATKAGLSERSGAFQSAQAARIAAEKTAKSSESRASAGEKAREQAFTESSVGQQILEEEAVLKAKIGSVENIVKQLEADAKMKVIQGRAEHVDNDEATEVYKKFLSTQANSKIVTDTLSTEEKTMADDTLKGVMAEGLEVDKKLGEMELEKNNKNADSAKPYIEKVEEEKQKLKKLVFERKKLQKALEDAEGETAKAEAETALADFNKKNTRKEEKIGQTINEMNKKIKEENEKDPEVMRQKQEIKDRMDEQKKKSSAWQYAASKARSEESGRALSVKQNTLLSDVEQREIYNKRGIQTPTNAISELVEKYEKEFNQMSYEMVVNNMRDNLKEMLRRQSVPDDQKGADDHITESDKASLAGLFKHAFNNGWVDDAIPSIMNDPELREMAKETFGWDDQEFNIEKINEVQALFATGMNKKFAKVHSQVGKMMDVAEEELGMGMEEFFQKWENNGFSKQELNLFKQKKINLSDVLGDPNGGNAAAAKANALEYVKTTEDNQAQLQLLGNLRDQAIIGNHPENAGHSQYTEIAPGKGMYIMKGAKSARNYVYGDVNKMNVTKRAAMHTHAVADLDESDGLATKFRKEDLRVVRANINNANDRRPTNVRYGNQAAGLTATEDHTQYLAGDNVRAKKIIFDQNGNATEGQEESAAGAFLMTGMTKNGAASKRHLNRSKKFKKEYAKMSPEQQRCATIADAVQNIFVPQIATVPKDFLMGMAEKSGVDPIDAVTDGKMNMVMSYWDEQNEKEVQVHIGHINDLIGLYNNGKFGKPAEKLNKYSQEKTARRGGGNGGSAGDRGRDPRNPDNDDGTT